MSIMLDIDSIPICVAVYKKVGDDFIFIDFNKNAEKVEKISKKDLIGRRLIEVFPGIKEFGLLDVLLRVEKSGESEVLNTAFYEDSRISGYRKNEIVRLCDGSVAAFYTDTTEEKKLETLLEEQRDIFQKIMQDTEDIMVQGINNNHEVIYWNKGSEKVYDYSAKEAMGKKIEELIVPENIKEIVYQDIEEWIHNGVEIRPTELKLIDKHGNDIHVLSKHIMIQVGVDKYELYGIDINLSTTKALQKELKLQRDFLKTLLDTIPDLVWAKDIRGEYISCNSIFEQFFGAKESEIVGKTDFDFLDKKMAESFKKSDKITMQKGSQFITEEHIEFLNGGHKGYFETIKTPFRDSEDKIRGILGISRDISLRKKHEQQLLTFANTDILTGLSNRAVLIGRLEQLIKRRSMKKQYSAILFMDLDNFKEINDLRGHHIGDKLLIEVSKRLKSIVRKGDTVARFGGDEFVLLLEEINTPMDSVHVAKKALEVIVETIYIEGLELEVGVSIGISIFPDDSDSSEQLLRYADDAMYHAKRSGRDMYVLYKNIKTL